MTEARVERKMVPVRCGGCGAVECVYEVTYQDDDHRTVRLGCEPCDDWYVTEETRTPVTVLACMRGGKSERLTLGHVWGPA